MSPVEFDQAAEDGTRVRLKDRSQCFYEDEWYEADITAGLRMIHTHTGESHRVDPELLEQLTTAREAESGAVGGVKAVKMLDGIARMLGAEAACWIRDAASGVDRREKPLRRGTELRAAELAEAETAAPDRWNRRVQITIWRR